MPIQPLPQNMSHMSLPPIPQPLPVRSRNQAQPTDLLHFKPLSHHICYKISSLGTYFHQNQREGLSRFTMVVGYTLNTVIAMIEFTAAIQFALLAALLQAATKNQSPLIRSLASKVYAYNANTLLIAGLQILGLKKNFVSRYYTINTLLNHAVHGISALTGQLIGNSHQLAQSNSGTYIKNIFFELAPRLIKDVIASLSRDFALHIRNHAEGSSIRAFIQNNPNYEHFLNHLSFDQLRRPEQRQQLIQLISSYLVSSRVLQTSVQNPAHVYEIGSEKEDKHYQTQLMHSIKASYIELHDNEKLVKLLSKPSDVKEGREELLAFMRTTEFANYAQYKELKSTLDCPADFKADKLRKYNRRQQQIQLAKEKLKNLDPHAESILVKKLLCTSDLDLKSQNLSDQQVVKIQELFNLIGELSGHLHQGLLNQEIMDVDRLNRGDLNSALSYRNLFQQACQDATEVIEKRP
ncbi:MAG: hypothetical protein BGO14_03490 [Chlamydiales bacterium 38-26]|nr:hypothetical protein [Chlamydiales bacterium]OJV09401.1 MAG: hypothetical protein BGO14_03490 [Chlamydiales bacterium 38-26]